MKIELAYGKGHIKGYLPDDISCRVYTKELMQGLPDPAAAVAAAVASPIGTHPLSRLAAGKSTACIVVNDITRPVPNRILLPPIIDAITSAGISADNISILNATGTHRPNLGDEITEILGPAIASRFRFVNHDCFDDMTNRYVGTTARGTEVFIDSTYLDADLKIITGLIEPHFMAGYSGGRKAVCPGVASIKSIRSIHHPKFMEEPLAANCIISGNPLHDELLTIARMAGVDFMANVVINGAREICGVFCGDVEQAHLEGIAFSRRYDCVQGNRVDVVFTSSAGYPLDKTFYQTIKGMVGALGIVKKGGTVVIASQCSEGMGNDTFIDCLKAFRANGDIDAYIRHISCDDNFTPDQWQVEKLLHAIRHADILLISEGLSRDELDLTLAKPVANIGEAIEYCLARHGCAMTAAVIPEGPYLIPSVS